jgi:hypothetical protein
MAALRGQDQNPPSREDQQKKEFESQFPIVDYEAPPPADPEKRAKRQARGKKYNNSPLGIDPISTVAVGSTHWAMNLPALPVAQSNAVVVGEVINAQAYLSDDRTGVYSEFTIRVDEVLKNDGQPPLVSGCSIDVERMGGRVRFASGHVGQYFIPNQGMPRIGRRYVLFLKRNEEGQDYSLITGYELRTGRVFLLDNPGPGHPITAYKGADETSFLNEVRTAIIKPSAMSLKQDR